MSKKKHSDIRQLALAFYRGWIPREKYVALRKEYLDAVSAGKKPRSINSKELAPPKRKTDLDATARLNKGSDNKLFLIAGIVAAVIILLTVIFLSGDDKEKPEEQLPTEVTSAPVAAVEKPVETSESRFNEYLTSTFIQNREWTPESLNVLKFKWQSLSQEQQTTIRGDSGFTQFSEILINKIIEERKLDNIVPSDRELLLMTAARNMGLTGQLPEAN